MDKKQAINHIRIKLSKMLELAKADRDESQQEANNHVGAMESRYDTFKEEAQYLVSAQNKRINELETSLEKTVALLNSFEFIQSDSEKVVLSSIISLADENNNLRNYFLATGLGGEKIEIDGTLVTVITPNSPIGQKLIGKYQYDEIPVSIQGQPQKLVIAKIS